MRRLFDTEYKEAATRISTTRSSPNIIRSNTQSKLDADFDDDEEDDADELERYISEKPANKDTDVLAWWKVECNMLHIVGTLILIPANIIFRRIRHSIRVLPAWPVTTWASLPPLLRPNVSFPQVKI